MHQKILFLTTLLIGVFFMSPVFSQDYRYKGFKCSEKQTLKDDKYNITIYQFCKHYDKSRARKIISYHQLGGFKDLVKSETYDYTYSDGGGYKKSISTYKNEKMVKSKLYDTFVKSENKTYDVIDYVRSETKKKREYYHQGKLIKTRPF